MFAKKSHLLTLAKAQGVCLSSLYDGRVFVLIDTAGVFVCWQSLRAMSKLVDFFRANDRKDVPMEFVALRSDVKRLGKTRKINWVHHSQARPRYLRQGKYVYLFQWIVDQEMRPKPKAIVRGPYQGGQLVPSFRGFQQIHEWDGSHARFLGMRLALVPNFLVSWMVDYPL